MKTISEQLVRSCHQLVRMHEELLRQQPRDETAIKDIKDRADQAAFLIYQELEPEGAQNTPLETYLYGEAGVPRHGLLEGGGRVTAAMFILPGAGTWNTG